MSIEGQGHFFTIYFSGFVCFVLYKAKISGERLQDHWSSGLIQVNKIIFVEMGKKAEYVYLVCKKVSFQLLINQKPLASFCSLVGWSESSQVELKTLNESVFAERLICILNLGRNDSFSLVYI